MLFRIVGLWGPPTQPESKWAFSLRVLLVHRQSEDIVCGIKVSGSSHQELHRGAVLPSIFKETVDQPSVAAEVFGAKIGRGCCLFDAFWFEDRFGCGFHSVKRDAFDEATSLDASGSCRQVEDFVRTFDNLCGL